MVEKILQRAIDDGCDEVIWRWATTPDRYEFADLTEVQRCKPGKPETRQCWEIDDSDGNIMETKAPWPWDGKNKSPPRDR